MKNLAPIPLTDAECGELLVHARWPEGVCCPRCNRGDALTPRTIPGMSAGLNAWRCRDCRYNFSTFSGTIFEKSCSPMRTVATLCLYPDRPIKQLARLLHCDRNTVRRIRRAVDQSLLAEAWRAELKKRMEAQ